MTASRHKHLSRLFDTLQRTTGAGRVVTAGPDYDASRHIWNGAVLSRSGVIVRCKDPSEARTAVVAAQEFGVRRCVAAATTGLGGH